MAQQFLYRANVIACPQQAGGKAMSKRVATRRLQYAGAAYRRLHRGLHYLLVHAVANQTARINIFAVGVGGKYVLLTPLNRSIGKFTHQCSRQRHAAHPPRLLFESNLQFQQVHPKRVKDRPGQDRDSILAALRLANDQFAALQTYFLDA